MTPRSAFAYLTTLMLAAAAPAIHAADDRDAPSDLPTHFALGQDTVAGVTALYQFDVNRYAQDRGRFDDAATNRRKYLGLYLRHPGLYDAIVQYDFQAKQWSDTYIRVRSQGLLGADVGLFRFGYSKTPVGFEGATSAAATTFIETALPTQAVWEGRRSGLDWAFLRPTYLVNVGYYFVPEDLDGNNPGRSVAARFAWVPIQRDGHVLHLGISASRETPEWHAGQPPSARFRARPEDGLSPVMLVDSGTLPHTDRIDRRGLEALWIDGPWSVQGEYLQATAQRGDGLPDYKVHGYYAYATWTLTGESRVYADGSVSERRYRSADRSAIHPAGHAWGALEIALRYSQLDMDDTRPAGGREHDWTLGANWYLGTHLKFQANEVWAASTRQERQAGPHITELRAQLSF
ncbi:OprO/OprP family phosphate-selective porin [Dyella agri]|uniref:Porin n=1 Tax=Dyella agri TaxID=1926869 RepID=A0ABW8KFB2_9GAMM